MLAPVFNGLPEDVTEENIQARIRGNILMALSNKFRGLVISTGNKSEMSVGYSTLVRRHGRRVCDAERRSEDAGLQACRVRESSQGDTPVIPEYIITRAPSAELRPDQVDQDTLPPYPVLDAILEAYIEEDMSAESIAEMGFDIQTVRWVLTRVDASEYKRRQSPPGIKITPRAFGRDRRMPITNKFRNYEQMFFWVHSIANRNKAVDLIIRAEDFCPVVDRICELRGEKGTGSGPLPAPYI